LSRVFAALLLGSCTKDFEDINTNPHGFTTASDGALFNNVIKSLRPVEMSSFTSTMKFFTSKPSLRLSPAKPGAISPWELKTSGAITTG
jgi:hypothetical protein